MVPALVKLKKLLLAVFKGELIGTWKALLAGRLDYDSRHVVVLAPRILVRLELLSWLALPHWLIIHWGVIEARIIWAFAPQFEVLISGTCLLQLLLLLQFVFAGGASLLGGGNFLSTRLLGPTLYLHLLTTFLRFWYVVLFEPVFLLQSLAAPSIPLSQRPGGVTVVGNVFAGGAMLNLHFSDPLSLP